jgi:hypothetical protein
MKGSPGAPIEVPSMETWRSPANLGHFGTMPGVAARCSRRRDHARDTAEKSQSIDKLKLWGRSLVGALMEYVITTAFLVGLVVAGFGTAIFTGYEVARFVASAM